MQYSMFIYKYKYNIMMFLVYIKQTNVLIEIKMGIGEGRISYYSTNKKRKMREKDNSLFNTFFFFFLINKSLD